MTKQEIEAVKLLQKKLEEATNAARYYSAAFLALSYKTQSKN
jgi:hypothetical protein